jgi:hypothetical protein
MRTLTELVRALAHPRNRPAAVLITECPGDQVVGHCPACHKAVFDADEPVWTCPANLSEGNPHREVQIAVITEEMREKAGVFSNCGEDFGQPCCPDMPLHSDCYDGKTGVTW